MNSFLFEFDKLRETKTDVKFLGVGLNDKNYGKKMQRNKHNFRK